MAFIKVENIVINTTYIAAIKLEGQNAAGEEIVSLLAAIPNFPLAQPQGDGNACRYEWIEFTGGRRSPCATTSAALTTSPICCRNTLTKTALTSKLNEEFVQASSNHESA